MSSHEGSAKERASAKRDRPTPVGGGSAPLMMRKCQACHRAGQSRSQTVGLCEECDANIAEEVHQRVQVILEALRKVRREASVGAKLRDWDLIIAQAEALLKYEGRDILTTCPPPSTLLHDFQASRDAVLGTE